MTETYYIAATDEEMHAAVAVPFREIVYFLSAPSVGMVKIGRTYRPIERFAEIQAMSPVPLFYLGCVEGGAETELDWHRKAMADHVHGEWFRLSETLAAQIHVADMLQRLSKLSPEAQASFIALAREYAPGPIPETALQAAAAQFKRGGNPAPIRVGG